VAGTEKCGMFTSSFTLPAWVIRK